MKTVIRPETEMKDSGIEWIGNIPNDWKVSRVGNFFSFSSGDSLTNEDIRDDGMYLVYGANGIRGYYFKYNLDKKRILLGRVGALAGNVHIVDEKVWVTEHALIASDKLNLVEEYYGYVFESMNLIQYSKSSAQPVISGDTLQKLRFPVPELSEQQAIADYLDETCSKIDEIIAEAKASIDEYKELKQSVIFEAVTKGLDKNVEMKDSGVEWIGEIPVDWVVKKIKYVATVNTNLVSPIGYEDYHQIAPNCIEKDSGRLIKERTVSEAGVESWNQLFKQGQLIYSKIRPTLNKVIIAPYDGLCSADMYPLDVHENIYFVQFVMLSKYFVGQVGLITQDRVKMPKINQDELSNVYVAVPKRTEQQKIVDWLNEQLPRYDSLISEKESLINDLEAYKKSLIYEVVTGKRRVV